MLIWKYVTNWKQERRDSVCWRRLKWLWWWREEVNLLLKTNELAGDARTKVTRLVKERSDSANKGLRRLWWRREEVTMLIKVEGDYDGEWKKWLCPRRGKVGPNSADNTNQVYSLWRGANWKLDFPLFLYSSAPGKRMKKDWRYRLFLQGQSDESTVNRWPILYLSTCNKSPIVDHQLSTTAR